MRVQIDLCVSKYRRKFFDAIGCAAFGEFVGEVFGVVISQLHRNQEPSVCEARGIPNPCGPWKIYPAIAGKGNRNNCEMSEGVISKHG